MDIILTKEIMQQVIDIMEGSLIKAGVDCAFLVDRSGNLIVSRGDPPNLDVLALATLTAANFGATAEIATIVGEEDFSLLYHKGQNENDQRDTDEPGRIGDDQLVRGVSGHFHGGTLAPFQHPVPV